MDLPGVGDYPPAPVHDDGWSEPNPEPRDSGPLQAEAALKSPPVFTPGAVIVLVAGAFLVLAIGSLPDVEPVYRAILVAFIAMLSGSPMYFSWRISQSAGPRTLALFSDHVLLPINTRTTHRLSVRFPEITGLLFHERDGRGFLMIGTGRFDFFYPLRSFRERGEARAFVDALRGQLRDALPHGEQKIEGFDAEGARAAEAMMRRPWALVAIAASLLLGTLVQWSAGGFERPFSSVEFGALARPLVWGGDWYRVFAHVFVQETPLPVLPELDLPSLTALVHAIALFVLGQPLERLLGGWFVVALFVIGTSVGAAFVVAANQGALIHGAGAAIFAYVGAMIFLAYQAGPRIPLGFRLSHRYWFWAIALGFLIIFSSGVTFDLALGGLLAGVLTVAPFVSGPIPRKNTPGWLRPVAVAGSVLFVASFAYAVQRAPDVGLDSLRPVIERHDDPQRLNYYAWEIATAEDPSAEELAIAETASRRSLDYLADSVGAPAVKDTLATILFRRGDLATAVDLQREVVADSDEPIYASQLARFMSRAQTAGVVQTSTTVRVSLRGRLADDGRLVVQPDVRGTPKGPLTVFGVVRDADRVDGLVRVSIDPAQPEAEQTLDTPERLSWTRTTTLAVSWVEPGKTTSRAWPMVDEVRAYPSSVRPAPVEGSP